MFLHLDRKPFLMTFAVCSLLAADVLLPPYLLQLDPLYFSPRSFTRSIWGWRWEAPTPYAPRRRRLDRRKQLICLNGLCHYTSRRMNNLRTSWGLGCWWCVELNNNFRFNLEVWQHLKQPSVYYWCLFHQNIHYNTRNNLLFLLQQCVFMVFTLLTFFFIWIPKVLVFPVVDR